MSSQEASALEGAGRANRAGKRSMILAACRRCRQRKKRCDGQRPSCSECQRSNYECDYEAVAANETRGSAARRQTAALQSQLDEITTSLTMLKHMPHEDAMFWLSALRSSNEPLAVLRSVGNADPVCPASVSESSTIRGMLYPLRRNLDCALGIQHPSLYPLLPIEITPISGAATPKNSSAPKTSPEGFSVAADSEQPQELCDDRLRNLDISYWSTVPIPNDLAARLLSLYLETDHPLHSPFDSNLFLDDLTTRTVRFCSSLLVNSVLFWACRTYGAIEPNAIPFASHFQTAALRLLRALENESSIMNVASLFCLTVGSICGGEDANAKTHLRSFLCMAVSLRLHGHDSADSTELGLFAPDWLSAFSHVAWSSYNFCCIYISHYRGKDWMDFVSRPPRLPVPGSEIGSSLYPALMPPPNFIGQTFAQYCTLLPINRGVLFAYLDADCPPAQGIPLAFAEERYQRLWNGQTSCLPRLLCQTICRIMQQYCNSMSFHAIVMELFRPFLGRQLKLSRFPYPDTAPEEVFGSSANRMVEVFRLYHTKFRNSSFAHTITWLIAPIYTAHISLKVLPETLDQRRQDFRLCAHALMGLGVVVPMKESIVRGIMSMAVQAGLFSLRESRRVMAEAFKDQPQQGGLETTLTIDFDRAMEDPSGSTVDAFARGYHSTDTADAWQ